MTRLIDPHILLESPGPLLDWLRSFPPEAIVATDMMDKDSCLGTNFLRAQGHNRADVVFTYGHLDGRSREMFPVGKIVSIALLDMVRITNRTEHITAGEAIQTILAVIENEKDD